MVCIYATLMTGDVWIRESVRVAESRSGGMV